MKSAYSTEIITNYFAHLVDNFLTSQRLIDNLFNDFYSYICQALNSYDCCCSSCLSFFTNHCYVCLFIVTIEKKRNRNFSWFIYSHKHSVVPVMPSSSYSLINNAFFHSFIHSFHAIPLHATQCLFVLVIRHTFCGRDTKGDLKKDRKRKFASLFKYFINGIINCCCCCCLHWLLLLFDAVLLSQQLLLMSKRFRFPFESNKFLITWQIFLRKKNVLL